MKWLKNKNQWLGLIAFTAFVFTGTYNAVVINSQSTLSGGEVRFVKRLDEIYGITVPGRQVAASGQWQKIASSPVLANSSPQIIQEISSQVSAPSTTSASDVIPAAAVQEELTLNLVEVINTNKWKDGLSSGQFSGSLSTNQGVIENLSVSLPNGEGVSVSFSEMTGNVFEYDLNGELYSGMMYQIDQNAYMVTLTNGPLEGTRLRFNSSATAEPGSSVADNTTEQQNDVASNENTATGLENTGDQTAQPEISTYAQNEQVSPVMMLENDRKMQEEAVSAQSLSTDGYQAM